HRARGAGSGGAFGRDDQTIALRPARGRMRTTFRAGLALNMTCSLVNGLMPMCALVAGFRFTGSRIRPGTLNTPGPALGEPALIMEPMTWNTAATSRRWMPTCWA